jgi:8-oxo-dGTP pyrophosphatase MutT (NUDIX family)
MTFIPADMNLVYGVILMTPNHKVLLVKGRHSGKWSFPKGHPHEGESGFECAKRETYEETGHVLQCQFDRVVHLQTGTYYLVKSDEFTSNPIDTTEIVDSAWIPLESMRSMPINVDVSTFLRHHTPTKSVASRYNVKPIHL